MTHELDTEIGPLLNRLRGQLLVAIDTEFAADEQLAPLKPSAAQFVILATLDGSEAKYAADLCKRISYDTGSMSRMIDRLQHKGLLRRHHDGGKRRLVRLELTPEGSAALCGMRRGLIRVLNRFLRSFTTAEARQLEHLLTRMLENATRRAPGAVSAVPPPR